MRVLNGNLVPVVPCNYWRKPEFLLYEHRDIFGKVHYFAWDANSLFLASLDSREEFEKLEKERPVPHIAARYTPCFVRGPIPEKPMSLVLQATHACNLACKYCFVEGYYPKGVVNMSFDTAKEAIDRFCDFQRGEVSVGFFGGEPLLNWDLIVRVVDYVENRCSVLGGRCRCGGVSKKCGVCGGTGRRRPSFHITTNGTLIDREKAKFLSEHRFSLIVSIDGPKEVNDKFRVDRKGEGTYDRIMAGLEEIRRFPNLVKSNTLRSTFTCKVESISELLEHLNYLCDQGYANWASVEPCELAETTCDFQRDLEIKEEHIPRLLELYERAAWWWVDRAKSGKTPRFHNVHKVLERIFYGIHSGTECGGGVGYMSVNGLGEIFACHREAGSKIGDLDYGIDEFERAKWIDNRIYTRMGCSDCDIRFVCGGGCRQDSLVEYGDIRVPSDIQCRLKHLWFFCALLILESCPRDLVQKYVSCPVRLGYGLGKCLKWIDFPDKVKGVDRVCGVPVRSLVRESAEGVVSCDCGGGQ